jgi:hypothetical protein
VICEQPKQEKLEKKNIKKSKFDAMPICRFGAGYVKGE